ncbi:hypothetical protein GOB94_12765 [Granulicella sp. 5B5]|uniref:IPT/TIG domain-containing protein n=1 Tax=Granulicella sp. 5B5 TaxID=1617967 RepID=UPI0015F72576|nr:IPT/TIG domain-containing protein [Granulicella sp. 5B5]QMV19460.1 hypothetical protein GOB94_12765 [Granulicella sp. 5B5]
MLRASRLLASLAWMLLVTTAWAGGPRFVTGTQYPIAGLFMAFYTPQVTYSTDAGTLSSTLTHAQSDAMVTAAAQVWNVPTASLTLSQSGELTEHVSSANAYFDGTNIVFPADVQATNYLQVPIAVIYDTDGSVTDLLLGSGASDPSGCRQNGVTESVDGFGATGTIQHALLVLNGRCITSAPQSLTQMQYQLMRAFGRVLGLAWSQVNDNVFTGSSQPTAMQMQNWPVMHPIDVVCGLYTYQCMQNPFTLRPDDLSALALLYPVTATNLTAGKTISTTNGAYVEGWTSFPTEQGMDLLNMTVTLTEASGTMWESWQTVSGISGVAFQANGGNPVSGAAPETQNSGVVWTEQEAQYEMGDVPVPTSWEGMLVQPEAINPLYTGEYSLGPYVRTPMSMAGGAPNSISPFANPGVLQGFWITMTNEPASCSPGDDGTEASPVAVDPSGWWSGLLCGPGHSSWWSMRVQANRTWTIETTALDEDGAATVRKAQPVIGVWNSSDPTGTLPTVASQATAMNAMSLGVTQLRMPATAVASSYRFVVADQFGGGRPDFAYQARVLYADSVSPATVGLSGGTITITGVGFRQGNEVLVNGVRAQVVSWSATQIVATAPSQSSAGAGVQPVDVEVLDASTGGSTDISGVFTYASAVVVVAGLPAEITAVSGAGQSVYVGTALNPVVLQVSDSNGNPVSGATVNVYQTVYAWEGTCAAKGPCASAPVLKTQKATMTSDANGHVSVTPLTVSGQPQVVEMAVSSGATGFVSLSLVIAP